MWLLFFWTSIQYKSKKRKLFILCDTVCLLMYFDTDFIQSHIARTNTPRALWPDTGVNLLRMRQVYNWYKYFCWTETREKSMLEHHTAWCLIRNTEGQDNICCCSVTIFKSSCTMIIFLSFRQECYSVLRLWLFL